MIDYSKLSSDKPDFDYDTGPLELAGYKCRWLLDPGNPTFKEVISELNKEKKDYKVMNGRKKQKDIWVKE